MSARFLLDQINFMADKILNFSVEYVSFSSLIPDVMDPIVFMSHYPANIYLFKVKNRNTRKKCEICSKLTNTRTTSATLF